MLERGCWPPVRADRLREAVGERERLLMAARARIRAVSGKHRLVEQMPAELDLLLRQRIVGGNFRDRKPSRQTVCEKLRCRRRVRRSLGEVGLRATGHAMTPTRIRPANASHAFTRLLPVRRVVAEIDDGGGECVALANPRVERVDVAGSTPAGWRRCLSTHAFIAFISTFEAMRSCTNRCMYACFASSRRFRPRYASARYSIASDDVGASVNARS